jgi:hypothetical protein
MVNDNIMTKTFLTVCLLLVITTIVQAQKASQKRRQVGLSVGWQNFKVLDKHASPLAYGTNAIFPKVGLSYSRQTSRSDFEIAVSGSSGQLLPKHFGARTYKAKWSATDSFQYTISSPFYHADIKASYYRNISSLSTNHVQYWLGGIINESAYYGDAVANKPWIINMADLSPALKIDYAPAAKHSIGVKIDFAAIAFVTRATYAFFPKSNKDKNVPAYFKQGTRLTFPDKYHKGSVQLTYQYQVSHKFAVGTAYSMKWIHYSYPKALHAMDKNFDIKFLYTY